MKYAIIPALALILQGCNQLSITPTEEWLQGSWVPLSESCESDGGIFFYPKGVTGTFNSEGIWTITGSTLTITNTVMYDDNMEEIPDNTKSTMKFTEANSHTFTLKYDNGSELKFKRCQTADELSIKNVTQKLIWDWTGGFSNNGRGWEISKQCRELTDDLETYLNSGWKIKSTSPFERYVTNGSCQGRDIVLEREE